MTKKPVSNAPPPFKPVRGLSLPRSQSNSPQVHQVHKPDWSMWSGDQRVDIEEAVALTMDIDPTPLLRVQNFITPESFPEDRRADFSKRQIALQGLFPGKSSIKLFEAMDRVVKMKWSGLPPELVAMAVLPVPKPRTNFSQGDKAGLVLGPVAVATELAEDSIARQDRRLKACEDAGLKLPVTDYDHLPKGVGKLAKADGVSRQAFSQDVKKALSRRYAEERSAGVLRHG